MPVPKGAPPAARPIEPLPATPSRSGPHSARPLDPVTLPMQAQRRPGGAGQSGWFWPVVVLASFAVMGGVAAAVFVAVGAASREGGKGPGEPTLVPVPKPPVVVEAMDAGTRPFATAEPRDAGASSLAAADAPDAGPSLAAQDTRRPQEDARPADVADAGALATDETPPPGATGSLEVTAKPAMGLSVDGVDKGSTPQVLKLAPGRHLVRLRNAGLDVTHEEPVVVVADKRVALAWSPKRGWLDLRAVPATANLKLTVDGKPMGTTPLDPVKLYEGQHLVKVTSESGWSAQTQVHVPAESHVLVWARSEVGLSVEAK